MVAETRTYAAAYPQPKDAQATVKDLRQAGLAESEISVIYTDSGNLIKAGVVDGAVWGGVLGGLFGLLFPPAGLIVAAGPVLGVLTSGASLAAVSSVTVAAFEGVITALISLGLPKDIATQMGEHLKKGDALVIAHVVDPKLNGEVSTIMETHHPRAGTAAAGSGVVSAAPSAA
jgi:hypothetical protein